MAKGKTGKRKTYKRKNKIPKKISTLGSPSKCVRRCYLTSIVTSTLQSYGALSFKLSDLPATSDFVNLFDEYMITKIKLQFIPTNATAQLPAITTYSTPWFMIVVDHDDSTVPTTYDTLLQYPRCKIVSMTRGFNLTFTPKSAKMIYQSAVATAYGTNKSYIDMANPDVPHYGIKYALAATSYISQFSYTIFAEYTFMCKGVR